MVDGRQGFVNGLAVYALLAKFHADAACAHALCRARSRPLLGEIRVVDIPSLVKTRHHAGNRPLRIGVLAQGVRDFLLSS